MTGALQLDGTITANGAGELPDRLGGGAGGSILVATGILSGSGVFSAAGADAGSGNAGGGSGGRIAVSYRDAAPFTGFTAATAGVGNGFRPGEPGTVAFFDTSTSPPQLHVYQQLAFDEDSSLTYDAIILDNGATLRVGGGSTLDIIGALTLRGRSTLLLEGQNTSGLVNGEWRGAGVIIDAANVTVAAGSAISAAGQGYLGSVGPGAGASEPRCNAAAGGGGGGYGGAGGQGQLGAAGGIPYGSPLAPTDLGSGGGNNPGCGQTSAANTGGGAIRLNVTGALQLEGAITVNAAGELPERLGGGAVYVTTATLLGAGLFSADGADAGSTNAGGGGGGRVAVHYASGAAFTGFGASTAHGGTGSATGKPGTVNLIDTVCDGDCNSDSSVTIDELIKAVNIALGTLLPNACPAVDSDGNGLVTIDDLIRAVNRALNGCGEFFTPGIAAGLDGPAAGLDGAAPVPSNDMTSVGSHAGTPTTTPHSL